MAGLAAAALLPRAGLEAIGTVERRTRVSAARLGDIGGGGENGRIVRASSFRIDELSVERPLVTLFGGSPGKTVPADGILGLPLIRCFNLAIDAGRRPLWVKRSSIALPDDH